jgi:hypothetical protein
MAKSQKYNLPFYEEVRKTKKCLILNGHSTIRGHSSLKNEKLTDDIVLSNYLVYKNKKIIFCPTSYIDFYAKELKKRLPDIKIGKNSVYISSYDYICHRFGKKIPAIHQETEESLYINGNKINKIKLKVLRKAFAESLLATLNHFS